MEKLQTEISQIIKEYVIDIITDSINPDINFLDEYSLDSIILMQILFDIEEKYNILFEEDDMEISKLSNINSLCEIINNKKGTNIYDKL